MVVQTEKNLKIIKNERLQNLKKKKKILFKKINMESILKKKTKLFNLIKVAAMK